MTYANTRRALSQYNQVGLHSEVESASPHRLIEMLLDGALGKLRAASRHLERKEIAAKAEQLSLAANIVGGLRGSLDLERGGEIAANLDALYDYIERRIAQSNAANDPAGIREVHDLLLEVRAGWSGIAPKPDANAAESWTPTAVGER